MFGFRQHLQADSSVITLEWTTTIFLYFFETTYLVQLEQRYFLD